MLRLMDTSLWLLPALLIAIALAAPRYGVDSRDRFDWTRRFGPPEPLPADGVTPPVHPRPPICAALARFARRTAVGWTHLRRSAPRVP